MKTLKYEKQERFYGLKDSREVLKSKVVAIIGIGGLGSHSAEYLVRMGIGKLILVDGDIVEISNLPRQGLYTQKDSETQNYKVFAAKKLLKEINPDVQIVTYNEMLSKKNIDVILENVDLVLDGSDNMLARYLVNDYCFSKGIPWIYAAATSSIGLVSNFIPGKTPCLRCIYGDLSEDQTSCDINGIILPALTFITSLQVTEALKILLDKEPILGELRYDIWTRKETIFDTSLLNNPECDCKKNKQQKKMNVKYYMICSGDTIQVNTEFSKNEIEAQFESFGYGKTRENELFIELIKNENDDEKIIGYKNGKIIFHHIDKTKIQMMMK